MALYFWIQITEMYGYSEWDLKFIETQIHSHAIYSRELLTELDIPRFIPAEHSFLVEHPTLWKKYSLLKKCRNSVWFIQILDSLLNHLSFRKFLPASTYSFMGLTNETKIGPYYEASPQWSLWVHDSSLCSSLFNLVSSDK